MIKRLIAPGIRLIIICLFFLTIPSYKSSSTYARENQVSHQVAYRVALAWFYSQRMSILESEEMYPGTSVVTLKDANQKNIIAFVLPLEPQGFVVVTPSYDMNPVISFSFDSTFIFEESPENVLLNMLRFDIPNRLNAIKNGVVTSKSIQNARNLWDYYAVVSEEMGDPKDGKYPSIVDWDVSIGPFLTSIWGQGNDGGDNATFNYYTPPGPDGSATNYVSGCVSTAMAQILNYYEWPKTGTDSHSYPWFNGVFTQTLSANFGGTSYDWQHTLDDYSGGSAVAIERKAAGLVTYHAGVSVDMNYTSIGSGAFLREVDAAFKHYFRFSGEHVKNDGDFTNKLYDSMIANRPAILGITSAAGGHAIVVDGVQHNDSGDTTRYYHLNMGWDGHENNWYDIDPSFSANGYNWVVDAAVFDIIPTPDINDLGTTTTMGTYPVSWETSPEQGNCSFELQQSLNDDATGTLSDGAESGLDNWLSEGYWSQSTNYHQNGSFAFRGHVIQDSVLDYPGTLTLQKTLLINPTTTMSYFWMDNYGVNVTLSFEISEDGVNWTTLEVHDGSEGESAWSQVLVTASDLTSYIGEEVMVRFMVDYQGTLVYSGSTIGFYIDDFFINNCSFGDWTTIYNDLTSTTQVISVSQDGTYSYRVRPYCSQAWQWSDFDSIEVNGITHKIYLPLTIR